MPLAAAGEIRVLNGLLDTVFVSLHTSDPGTTGAGEIVGGAYARTASTFVNTGSNPTIASNDAIVQFPQATAGWGTITHFGLWSAAVAGSYLGGDAVTESKDIALGDIARWDIGKLQVSAD